MDKTPKTLTKENYSAYLAGLHQHGPTFHDPCINCLKYGYLPWRYIPNWPKNFVQFFRNIRYAWQRIAHGYCDWDTWWMDGYTATVIADMLDDLSVNSNGYPGILPYDTMESWETALRENAKLLRIANDEDGNFFTNPLEESYIDRLLTKDWQGVEVSDEDKVYFEVERNIYNKKKEAFDKASNWLKTYHAHLWD